MADTQTNADPIIEDLDDLISDVERRLDAQHRAQLEANIAEMGATPGVSAVDPLLERVNRLVESSNASYSAAPRARGSLDVPPSLSEGARGYVVVNGWNADRNRAIVGIAGTIQERPGPNGQGTMKAFVPLFATATDRPVQTLEELAASQPKPIDINDVFFQAVDADDKHVFRAGPAVARVVSNVEARDFRDAAKNALVNDRMLYKRHISALTDPLSPSLAENVQRQAGQVALKVGDELHVPELVDRLKVIDRKFASFGERIEDSVRTWMQETALRFNTFKTQIAGKARQIGSATLKGLATALGITIGGIAFAATKGIDGAKYVGGKAVDGAEFVADKAVEARDAGVAAVGRGIENLDRVANQAIDAINEGVEALGVVKDEVEKVVVNAVMNVAEGIDKNVAHAQQVVVDGVTYVQDVAVDAKDMLIADVQHAGRVAVEAKDMFVADVQHAGRVAIEARDLAVADAKQLGADVAAGARELRQDIVDRGQIAVAKPFVIAANGVNRAVDIHERAATNLAGRKGWDAPQPRVRPVPRAAAVSAEPVVLPREQIDMEGPIQPAATSENASPTATKGPAVSLREAVSAERVVGMSPAVLAANSSKLARSAEALVGNLQADSARLTADGKIQNLSPHTKIALRNFQGQIIKASGREKDDTAARLRSNRAHFSGDHYGPEAMKDIDEAFAAVAKDLGVEPPVAAVSQNVIAQNGVSPNGQQQVAQQQSTGSLV